MKFLYRTLIGLHLFVGLGAVFGGLVSIINPNAPFGVTTDLLVNSPFTNYLIPGIILFAIIGLGNVISGISFRFKLKYQGYISSVFSWGLVIWIVVQCIMLNSFVFIQALYLAFGIIQVVLSTIILFKQRLFPTNLIMKFSKKNIEA